MRDVPRVRVLSEAPGGPPAGVAPAGWEVEVVAAGPRAGRDRVDVVVVDRDTTMPQDVADHVLHSGFVVALGTTAPTATTASQESIGDVVLPGDAARLGLPPDTTLWLGRPARGGLRNANPPWWVGLLPGPGTPSSGSRAEPVVIVGAPRSGTTYLTKLLGQHRDANVTDETRNLVAVSRLLHRSLRNRNQVWRHSDRLADHLVRELPAVMESFYRGLQQRPVTVWGDKFPHYADGATNPEVLPLVARLWPRVRVVAIVRDPRRVVHSIVQKRWKDADEAISVWSRHTLHPREFATVHAPGRFHELRYEDLVDDGPGTWDALRAFLELPDDPAVDAFLAEQARARTPFSAPTATTPAAIGDEQRAPVPDRLTSAIAQQLPLQLVEFGYEQTSTREPHAG